MYAIIATGGKQYKVSAGEKLLVENLHLGEGENVVFDQVMMLAEGENIQVGAPVIAGAAVHAKVLGHERGEKIRIIKMKRRKHHIKTQGHRQGYTSVEITEIKQQ